MDTTEQYIRMCEKAGEIQALRERNSRGVIYQDQHDFTYQAIPADPERQRGMEVDDVWLPRQDDLQAFLLPKGETALDPAIVEEFSQFYWEREYPSMEQGWLCFVQWKLGGKIWTGEDWLPDRRSYFDRRKSYPRIK